MNNANPQNNKLLEQKEKAHPHSTPKCGLCPWADDCEDVCWDWRKDTEVRE